MNILRDQMLNTLFNLLETFLMSYHVISGFCCINVSVAKITTSNSTAEMVGSSSLPQLPELLSLSAASTTLNDTYSHDPSMMVTF